MSELERFNKYLVTDNQQEFQDLLIRVAIIYLLDKRGIPFDDDLTISIQYFLGLVDPDDPLVLWAEEYVVRYFTAPPVPEKKSRAHLTLVKG